LYCGCDKYGGLKDDEAHDERAFPRGARYRADYVSHRILFRIDQYLTFSNLPALQTPLLHKVFGKVKVRTVVIVLGVERVLVQVPVSLLALGLWPKFARLVVLAGEVARHPDGSFGNIAVVALQNRHGEEAGEVVRVLALQRTDARVGLADVTAVVLPAVHGVAEGLELVHAPAVPSVFNILVAAESLVRSLGVPGEDIEAAVLLVVPGVVGVDALGQGQVVPDYNVKASPDPGHLPEKCFVHVAPYAVDVRLHACEGDGADPTPPSEHAHDGVLVLGVSDKHGFGDFALRNLISEDCGNEFLDLLDALVSGVADQTADEAFGINWVVGRARAGTDGRAEQTQEAGGSGEVSRNRSQRCGRAAGGGEGSGEDGQDVDRTGGAAGDPESLAHRRDGFVRDGAHLLIELDGQLTEPEEVGFEGHEHVVESALADAVEIFYGTLVLIRRKRKYEEQAWLGETYHMSF
jgi:hypothetical protein